jgi:diguanylate cyclase (GGDEF)-like protein
MGVLDELLKRENQVLPPFPELGIKILQALFTKTPREIEEVFQSEKEIVDFILQIANLPRFRKGASPVNDFRMANLVLGETTTIIVTLGLIAKKIMRSTFNDFSFPRFWARALTQAVAAYFLADLIDDFPAHLPISAFLLDYGIVVMYLLNPERYLQVLQLKRGGKPLLEAEREVFGATHAEVGAEYFENYAFPRRFILNLLYHHAENTSEVSPVIKRDLEFLRMIDEGVGSFFSHRREERWKKFKDLAGIYLTETEMENFGEVFPDIANSYLEIFELDEFKLITHARWREEKERELKELELAKEEKKEDIGVTLEEYKNKILELHLEKKELERRLEHLWLKYKERTILDELTEVYKREYFQRRLKEELLRAKRYGRTFSLLLIELEKLEEIGKRFGAGEEERFLKEIAQVFKKTLRRVDLIGRHRDWNKFLIALPETPAQGAMVVARKLLRKIEELYFRHYQLKSSGFISVINYEPKKIDPKRESSEEALISLLEKGLELIKRNKQNRVLLLRIEKEFED